ncbi:DUF4145 domain-containing protein [Bacillus velezensis]|uniref:DUF4145 domain-containing protein n=1 Tax=Bacillus velezensis TaxID=492670 RepID=UPI002E207E9F|nr:DUF4145 domain-containing protein [Bacillus velezensis]
MKLFGNWSNVDTLDSSKYNCAYCDALVASELGIFCAQNHSMESGLVMICPNCNRPTFLELNEYGKPMKQVPAPQIGIDIDHLPPKIGEVYNEIRSCMSNQSYTAVVLLARKLLMNIAVDAGAEEGKKFVEYVDYLENEGFIPKNGKEWVDSIRKAGNIATHNIPSIDSNVAKDVLTFLEFFLRLIYEMPGKMAKK